MIITRTPFRVSFLGGGTDMPWFYKAHGGSVISTAIDKHMYLSAHPLFDSKDILLKYSRTELVSRPSELAHPIAKEILTEFKISGVDISVSADIPSGTGLGSSSAFTVGLIELMTSMLNRKMSKMDIAEQACRFEIESLGEVIGKQDQYASAFGGLNHFVFKENGEVEVHPINLNSEGAKWLNESMVLVRVGVVTRSASEQLKFVERQAKADRNRLDAFIELRDLTNRAVSEITSSPWKLGELTNKAWELKVASNPGTTNTEIDDLIKFGLKKGATGAKLLGAGQGGFVLFIVEPEHMEKFIEKMSPRKATKVSPDTSGTTVIYSN